MSGGEPRPVPPGPRRTTTDDGLVRGPKWRTRTSPHRHRAAVFVTFGMVVGAGTAIMAGAWWLADRLGAPPWMTMGGWAIPTVGVAIWSIVHAPIAGMTDDDDDTWLGHCIRWVLVGPATARPAVVRLVLAAVFGAPVGWAAGIAAVATVTGLA